MPLTNAEKQKRWRDRRNALAKQALKMQAAKDRRVAKLQARVELLETRIRDLFQRQGKKRGG